MELNFSSTSFVNHNLSPILAAKGFRFKAMDGHGLLYGGVPLEPTLPNPRMGLVCLSISLCLEA